jgi:hypothetical protein
MEEQHTYLHTFPAEPTINVKVEKNSRGFNYEITVVGAPSVEWAMNLIHDAELKLRSEYGEKAA